MSTTKIHSLTESSLLAAITVISALIAVYIPILGIAATFLWPLPIIVLTVRHSLRWAVLSIITAGILMSILIEPMTAIGMLLSFAPPALILGIGFRDSWPGARLLLFPSIAAIAGTIMSMGVLFAVTGINPLDAQLTMLQESMDSTFALYDSMGMSKEEIAQSKELFEKSFQLIGLLFPLAIVIIGVFTSWLNFIISSRILKRLGYFTPSLPLFDEWHLPKAFLYRFGFSMVGLYWGSTRELQLLYQVSLNLNFLATFAGLLQGASLLSALTRHFHLSRWLYWLIIVFVLLDGVLGQILAFTGLFDMIFDYRKKLSRRS